MKESECGTQGDPSYDNAGFPRHGWILISEENKVIVRNFDRDSN